MAIPIFGASVIPQATEKQLVSPSADAGVLGATSIAQTGQALEQFGNELDKAGKAAKDVTDKLTVKIAVNNARFAMMDSQASQQGSSIQQGDRPDGFTGVQRFKSDVDPKLKAIGDTLLDPKLQGMYYAEIGDDFIKDSTLVLADEVKKREQTIPILMQDNINGKGAMARADITTMPKMMGEVEHDLIDSKYVTPENLPKAILDAKKAIANQAVAGLVDKGMQGNGAAWDVARNTVKNDLSQILSPKEIDDQMKFIQDQQHTYIADQWDKTSRGHTQTEWQWNDNNRTAKQEIVGQLAAAKGDQAKINAITTAAAQDPRLTGEDKVNVYRDATTTSQVANDAYEITFRDNLMRTNANLTSMENELKADTKAGKITFKQSTDMQALIQARRDQRESSPLTMKRIDANVTLIKAQAAQANPMSLDQFYKPELDVNADAAASNYLKEVDAQSSGRNLADPDRVYTQMAPRMGIQDVKGRTPVLGVSEAEIDSPDKINDKINQIDRKFRTADPQTKKDLLRQRVQLKERQKLTTQVQNVKTGSSAISGANKAFDDK